MADPRPARNSKLLVGACVVLSCIVAYQLGSKPNYSQSGRDEGEDYVIEGLGVEPSALDFGQAWEEKKFMWKVPIRNRTSRDIKILDFALSCGCLEVQPKSLTIPANEMHEVSLAVDLTKERGLSTIGEDERPFAVQIAPIQNTKARPRKGWTLHGTVKSRITLDKLAINFGDWPVKGEPAVVQRTVAVVHIPAEMVAPRFDSKIIQVDLKHREKPANSFDIEVSPHMALPAGPFQTELNLDIIAPSGERLPGVSIPITGSMQPEIRLLPARLLLGSRPMGDVAEADVVLQAPDLEKLTVEQIETASQEVDVRPALVENVPPGRAFRVKQRVIKEGDQTNLVTFRIRRGSGARVTAPMEVCCQGTVAANPAESRGERKVP